MGKRDGLTRGWARRTFASTKVVASLGKHAARRAWATARGHEEEASFEGVSRLVEQLDGLKGPMMKLGQMVSYLDGALPPAAQEALRKLQRDAEPADWSDVAEQLERELGASLDHLFDAIESHPVAAASIGQVHKAVVDGEAVAVKVQYPGLSEAMDTDLQNLSRLSFVADLGSSLGGAALVQELVDRMNEEMDYALEARRQERFRVLLSDDHRVLIPRILPERSSDRVLTSTWAEGQDFYAFAETASQQRRNEAGLVLFEVAFRTIFGHAAFNGDPHPGNYRFTDDGRVVLLDWGCIREFEPAFVEQWRHVARIILDGERERFDEAFTTLGMVADPDVFDFDAQWKGLRYLYEPMLGTDFQFTQDYVRQIWRVLLWNNPNLRTMRLPPQWLLVQRLQWGLYSVLALLGAQGDFGEPFRRWLDSPLLEDHGQG